MTKSLPNPWSKFILLATLCIVVVALRSMEEVLVPIALAILFSFLLTPLAKWFERHKLPRVAAVAVTVVLAFGCLGGIGYVVEMQLGELMEQKQQYTQKIHERAESLGKVMSWFRSKGAEIKQVMGPATKPSADTTSGEHVQPVRVIEPAQSETSPLSYLGTIGASILGPLGTAFIVVVFTIFMLVQREDLRDRVIRLVGKDQVTTTTQALDDASERVSRYLLLQTVVNSCVGCLIAIALLVLGKIKGEPFPSIVLWGMLTALLRFVPYVGIWISSLGPILVALAVYSTGGALAVVLIYGTTEVLISNAVEPMLFGSSTGIATLAVLVAAAFWTWLWGPVGLLLSTPLTVCLVVMGKYVPGLEFLSVLLGDQAALSPQEQLYQRLLALDQEEADDVVADYAKKMPLEQLYDTVLMPVLARAELDRQKGNLDDRRYGFIHTGLRQIVDEQGELAKSPATKVQTDPAPAPGGKVADAKTTTPAAARVVLPEGCAVNVTVLPAADDADHLAGVMFAQLLELRRFCVTVASVDQLASEMVTSVESNKADVVVVSAVPPGAVNHARYLCKRLHDRDPQVKMVVGLWTMDRALDRAKERIACDDTVDVIGAFGPALERIYELAQPKLTSSTK